MGIYWTALPRTYWQIGPRACGFPDTQSPSSGGGSRPGPGPRPRQQQQLRQRRDGGPREEPLPGRLFPNYLSAVRRENLQETQRQTKTSPKFSLWRCRRHRDTYSQSIDLWENPKKKNNNANSNLKEVRCSPANLRGGSTTSSSWWPGGLQRLSAVLLTGVNGCNAFGKQFGRIDQKPQKHSSLLIKQTSFQILKK